MSDSWKEYVSEGLIDKRSFLVSKTGLVKKLYTGQDKYKILEGAINNGYRAIWVTKADGKRTAKYVHKMVAETFLPNIDNKEYVIHIDHEKLNNSIENLQWATLEEWKEHNKDLFRMMKGRSRLDSIPNSKLTENQVVRLKKKLMDPNRKTKIAALAKQFNISQGQVYRILRGENWSHIEVK
ncbi:HNH endonuclease signature motif containing protein [Faecalibacter rhinopitheci]|uniref:HNH endonuclease n=1 Tax=Faecalibacter rhinopitheci TaxID=2779678 RepID=A0A8J7K9V8_9FLAO|nr:HNH endonuclease signature motif containing protein [Faecalibacter rhinopitheci]MBF0596725.1 HNH endonuclease [Faecalibacter rhinopitheci]MBQ0147537.1 HNH endonuclease [Candidatus Onthonaster equi]